MLWHWPSAKLANLKQNQGLFALLVGALRIVKLAALFECLKERALNFVLHCPLLAVGWLKSRDYRPMLFYSTA